MSSSSRALVLVILVPLLALFASLAGRPAAAATVPRAAAVPAFHLAALPGPDFVSPVWVGTAGDGSAARYVVEQRGIVWKLVGRTRTRFLDLRSSVLASGEQGLLSIAFAQDFRTSGRMFAYYTRPGGNGLVRQFLVRRGRVVAGSGRDIIGVALSPPEATNHNGGTLWAGPRGVLYLSVGDGGSAGDPNGNAQHLGRLTGKLLRIVPRLGGGYVVPRSNPYVARRGARPEIYALGLRNPWRFSIDAPSGDIWIGDVGQDDREEVDRLRAGRPAGANFGWRRFEGTRLYAAGTHLTAATPYVRPVHEYSHRATGGCSITGGVVYRGSITALDGWYLYADYCLDTVTALQPATGATVTAPGASGVVHFGADSNGDVLAASQQTGRLYRVVAS